MYELSLEVWKFTGEQSVRRNFKYCDQIRDSSDSAHRNVAEGFGRYNPPEFARFLDISRGSAEETRGLQALAKLQRYLRSPEAKRNAQRWRHRRERSRVPQPPGRSDSNESTRLNSPNDSNNPNGSNGSNDSNDSNDPL